MHQGVGESKRAGQDELEMHVMQARERRAEFPQSTCYPNRYVALRKEHRVPHVVGHSSPRSPRLTQREGTTRNQIEKLPPAT